MSSTETICAVVVSYNRKALLIECLEALLRQSVPLDAICIVDNASSDGTFEALKERGFVKEPNASGSGDDTGYLADIEIHGQRYTKKLHYLRIARNSGSAGGFHDGMRLAHEQGFDWLWLMDDDVAPLPDGLAKLLKYRSMSQCIHGSRTFNGIRVPWEGYLELNTGLPVCLDDISFKNNKEYTSVNYGCFEGMLIHRQIIERIGYPDKRYFIMGDDTIYGFLASLHTHVLYIKDIILERRLSGEGVSNLKLYCTIRNDFLTREYLRSHSHLSYFIYLSAFRKLLKEIYLMLTFRRSLQQVKYACLGFYDGLTGRYDRIYQLFNI